MVHLQVDSRISFAVQNLQADSEQGLNGVLQAQLVFNLLAEPASLMAVYAVPICFYLQLFNRILAPELSRTIFCPSPCRAQRSELHAGGYL